MNHIEYLKHYQSWRTGELDMAMDEAGITPAELTNAIYEAIKDSERLNWIEKNARIDPSMCGNHTYWPTSFNKTIRGPSLRAAIDAAINSKA